MVVIAGVRAASKTFASSTPSAEVTPYRENPTKSRTESEVAKATAPPKEQLQEPTTTVV